MKKAFIIHGAFGNKSENWFPWLKENLSKTGFEVVVPTFPIPENQTLENWMDVFEKHIGKMDSETILIGHSLGPAFILHLLEKIDVKIKACFFVAGFVEKLGNETFDQINESFLKPNFDWAKIKNSCEKFFIYYSDNDPYVPEVCTEKLASSLGCEPILIKGAGHFNETSGYTKFERLLGDIKNTKH